MKKLFIVGCPRSGTTMIQQALNRHSQIVIPPETKFFFSFYGHSHRQQLRHIERLKGDLKVHIPKPSQRIASLAEGRAFYEAMAGRYLERLHKPGAVYFGEKSPEHTGCLARIRDMFPDAKILVVYRDGRDVAASLRRMPWMCSDLYVDFVVWLYYQWVVRYLGQSPSADNYFPRYEEVVANPAAGLRGILHFLGLAYEPAVAEGYGNREGIPERELAWKARALERITTERVGVFRQELSPDQIAILERLGRNTLQSLGYRLMTDGKEHLSAAFLLKLSCNLMGFARRLPRYSLVKELLNRSPLYRGNGQGNGRLPLDYPLSGREKLLA